MSKYRLVFKGQLIDGSDRGFCLEQLSKMFKEEKHTLEKRLFTGRRVIINRTDDEEHAGQIISAFEKAGARLSIETEGLDFNLTGTRDESDTVVDTSSTKKRRALKPAADHVPRPEPRSLNRASDDKMTHQRNAVPEDDVEARKARGRRRRLRRR